MTSRETLLKYDSAINQDVYLCDCNVTFVLTNMADSM